MTKEQIDQLLLEGEFPGDANRPDLIETHISWVLLCDKFAFKIKRPVCYSFLDFSTLDKRKYYCEKEIELNRRLTEGIYLDVLPVREASGHLSIGKGSGEIIDYAVRMVRMDSNRQMDRLLKSNGVKQADIVNLARKIAAFHMTATVIYRQELLDIHGKFSDLEEESDYLRKWLNGMSGAVIDHAIKVSGAFMKKNKGHLNSRLSAGFLRDCHGDLHSGNIFLLPAPQPFDCIEFNDDYRQVDVLNEVAFLCMDLDAFNRQDLSDLFLKSYNQFFPALKSAEDEQLFIYYKSYRANIRAKINSFRARYAGSDAARAGFLSEARKYLKLMDHYTNYIPIH